LRGDSHDLQCTVFAKAKVEVGVQIAQRWIVAALRHRKFFSLSELNADIRELLEKLNQRPFKKRDGCRRSLFEQIDQPVLRPLPAERYDLSVWAKATVNIDYHVAVDGSFYSVPYSLTQKAVEVRTTPTTVEIFYQGSRVASHVRARKPYTAVTLEEHRPKAHQACVQWPPSRLIDWAQKTGPFSAQLFRQLMDRFPHPEMGVSLLPGAVAIGREVWAEAIRVGMRAGAGYGRCQLQEREIDPEPLAGLAADAGRAGAAAKRRSR
jgi:transposase